MNRRNFLQAILATGVAPFVVTTAGVLMPVKKVIAPDYVATTPLVATQEGIWVSGIAYDGSDIIDVVSIDTDGMMTTKKKFKVINRIVVSQTRPTAEHFDISFGLLNMKA